jgi:hypothetical protein
MHGVDNIKFVIQHNLFLKIFMINASSISLNGFNRWVIVMGDRICLYDVRNKLFT